MVNKKGYYLNNKELHIEEENIQLFWGLIALVSIALATYMLTNAFMAGSWSLAGYAQITSLALFTVGFIAIIKVSSPLYRFVLSVNGSILTIEIWNEGDQPIEVKEKNLADIRELRISPHSPRLPGEALFDFSSSYHLLYRKNESADFKKLMDFEGTSFTLKVEDIGKIMAFLLLHNPDMYVPENDAIFVQLNQADRTTAG